MLKKNLLLFIFFLSLCGRACAATAAADVAKTSIWTLVDTSSGAVLLHNNQHKVVNPGDLVALMTLYTGLKLAQANNISFDSLVSINSTDAQISHSLRRIYLAPDTRTTLETLFHAIAVVGAEDAALAISRGIAGTHEIFVEQMNSFARQIGMNDSKFTSPINQKEQVSSAYDLALLSQKIFIEFPEITRWFKEKEFVFSGVKHRNRNLALWKNNEINGLMSNGDSTDLIASWSKEFNDKLGKRSILAVVLKGEDSEVAVNDALTLIRTARMDFDAIQLFEPNAVIARLDVMKGARNKIEVGTPTSIYVTLQRKHLMTRGTGGISTHIEYMSPLTAPIKKGEKIGSLRVDFEGKKLASFPVFALHDVGEGSFFSQYVDSVRIKMNKTQNQD